MAARSHCSNPNVRYFGALGATCTGSLQKVLKSVQDQMRDLAGKVAIGR